MPKKNSTELKLVEPLIRMIRGERIILDSDLAGIYGVKTKMLNRAVKRNLENSLPTSYFNSQPKN
jgi:hypothetical protein